MAPTRQEILKMQLDGLRPLLEAELGIEEWPSDWEVAGKILEHTFFNFQRASTGEHLFGITLFGEHVNGTGIDENPLVAIFRAYILMMQDEHELGY